MSMFRYSAGAVIALAGLVVICVIAGLAWVGQHAQVIKAGIGTLLLILMILAVAGCALVLGQAWRKARQQVPEGQVPAAVQHVAAEQVPLALPEQLLELASGQGPIHLHFHGLDEDQAVRVVRQAGAAREEAEERS